jgi:L-arabinose isomerase
MKEILDKYGKTLVDQINVGYARFKGEIDAKVGRTLEAQRAEIARWCEEVNRAFAIETENARRALIEATENIKKMEGLREGVLATPVSVRMVTPTFFEIEAIEGAQYDYIAIGP